MQREDILRRRIKLLTWFFIIALAVSGVTAIPLKWELGLATKFLGVEGRTSAEISSGMAHWILKVNEGLKDTDAKYPFMAYGTDWLAFGHFAIAVAFIGALRDPVRNRWLFQFGIIAAVLVVPYAFIFGGVRGIPIYWRLIDCSFGIFGCIPLWLCNRWSAELERLSAQSLTQARASRSASPL